MISIECALEFVFANLPERRIEQIHFQSALGRVLAENLVATCDIPPFDRSAMDGYALRAAETEAAPVELNFKGKIRAGDGMPERLNAGEAIAIMTGAPVPEGANAVQMFEQSQRSSDGSKVTILKAVRAGENIVIHGSETAAGEVVLESGRHIGPAEIAVMATFGYSQVNVWQKPSIALLSTGDELVAVDDIPRLGQIRNSNAYCIASQLQLMDMDVKNLGIARDDREDLCRLILMGLEKDILVITGGVSMGEYDFVLDVLRKLDFNILFNKVAIKPGKPTVFARQGDKLVFGLPGNPVSALVTFECFVRPALGRLCGMLNSELPRIKGELLNDMEQSPGRTAFLPAWVTWEPEGWKVEPFPWKSSADIVGFSRANAAVIFPGDRHLMRRGEIVESMLLPDYFIRQRCRHL